MPGQRLSHEDRRKIAVGLTDGLGYAEIARGLDRPTSTVGREVARNGGAAKYRADHAHQSTRQRARRGRNATRPDPARPHPGPMSAAAEEFIERFASMMAHTGLSRMAARVLTCIFTTDEAELTSAELVDRLRVSPASISHAVGYLERLGLLTRRRDSNSRRERYAVEDDVWIKTWLTSAERNANWAEEVAAGVEIFGASTTTGVRLRRMSEFFATLSRDMGPGPDHLDDLRTLTAALLQADHAMTADQLSTALGWSVQRAAAIAEAAIDGPDITDPLLIKSEPPDRYRIMINPDRLSTAQQAALAQGS